MQTPITLLATPSSGNAAKQSKTSSNEAAGSSFNQVLSKEISIKKNADKENATKKLDNKAADKSLNTKKPVVTEAPKTQAPVEDTSETTSLPVDPTLANMPFLALVENMAQFSANGFTPIAETDTTSKAVAAQGIEIVSDASLNSIAGNIAAVIADQTQLAQAERTEIIDASSEAGNAALVAIMSDASVKDIKAEKPNQASGIAAMISGEEGVKPLYQQVLDNLSGSVNTDQKPEMMVDGKTNVQSDVKASIQTDTKVSIQTDTKASIQTDTKAVKQLDSLTNLNPQVSGNTTEAVINLTEPSPSIASFTQQVAVSSGQINAASQSEHLAPRVGTPLWDQAIGQKIIWMVAGGNQTAELTLNPPDLGPMQVILNVSNEQTNATFISSQPDVREALESAMPKLRQMMEDAGLQLSGFSVKADASGQGSQFSGERSFSQSRSTPNQTGNTLAGVGTSTIAKPVTSSLGIVDTFA